MDYEINLSLKNEVKKVKNAVLTHSINVIQANKKSHKKIPLF